MLVVAPAFSAVSPPGWTVTGSMHDRREQHTATLLDDGTVLVAGGCQISVSGARSCVAINTAEIYDPVTGTWTATSSMSAGRSGHTATLLDDGMVLVAGGCTNVTRRDCVPVATAELYDPATGTWKSTGSMSVARWYYTAAVLDDGTVLVAGGRPSFVTYTATAELYDPATGTWTPTATMSIARSGHTATLLGDGTVLVAGGVPSSATYTATAELYDPSAGAWTVTGSMRDARGGHTATLLADGSTVLVAGGFNGEFPATAELYDLLSGTWEPTKSMRRPRAGHTAKLLENGIILVAGGQGGGIPPTFEATTELYNPATNVWTQSATMNEARTSHTATSLADGGTVLVAGGFAAPHGQLEDTATAELYGPVR